MKRLKLFPKIFLYTFTMMFLITILVHALIYFIVPNQNILIANSGIPEAGAATFSEMEMHQLFSETIKKAFPISMFCCVIISFGVSYVFSKAITNPICSIVQSTEPMKKMEPDARCTVSSADEIGFLSENINKLYQNLLMTIHNLEDEKEKVCLAEKEKLDFLRSASHELKTPVTELNATLENMLLGIGEYADYDTYLPKCKQITEELGVMIRDILNTSQLQMSASTEEAERIILSEFISQICEPYVLIAESKGIHFTLKMEGDVNIFVPPLLVKKAISNVISNAISYTDNTKLVTVKVVSNVLIVENECSPLSDEQLKCIFQPFYRLDFSHNKNSGGNGLGLYIVDTILNNLNIRYEFVPMTEPAGMRFIINFASIPNLS